MGAGAIFFAGVSIKKAGEPAFFMETLKLQLCVNLGCNVLLWNRTHDLVYQLTVFEDQKGGNATNTVVHRNVWILIHIQFSYHRFARIFA